MRRRLPPVLPGRLDLGESAPLVPWVLLRLGTSALGGFSLRFRSASPWSSALPRPFRRIGLGGLRTFTASSSWRLALGGLFAWPSSGFAASGFGGSSPSLPRLLSFCLAPDLESVAASGASPGRANRFALRPARPPSPCGAARRRPVWLPARLQACLLPVLAWPAAGDGRSGRYDRVDPLACQPPAWAPAWRPCPAFPAPASPDNACPSRRWTPGRMTAREAMSLEVV